MPLLQVLQQSLSMCLVEIGQYHSGYARQIRANFYFGRVQVLRYYPGYRPRLTDTDLSSQ